MKTLLLLIIFTVFTTTVFSQSLAGTYSGDVGGVIAMLQLQQTENQLSGKIDAQGYIYTLQGTVQGEKASGILSDPQTMGSMNFEVELETGKLTLILITQNMYSGATERTPLYFTKSNTEIQAQAQFQVNVQDPSSTVPPSAPCKQCDQQLVGAWIYTKTIFSGNFSSTTQLKMRIYPNGTYTYGNARVMASGSNDYDQIHADTGGDDSVTRGKWKTQNSVIYVMEDGDQNWYPYAKYYVENGSMLLTFDDGSKQLWERN